MYFLSQNERLFLKPSIHNTKIELNNSNKSEKNTDKAFVRRSGYQGTPASPIQQVELPT